MKCLFPLLVTLVSLLSVSANNLFVESAIAAASQPLHNFSLITETFEKVMIGNIHFNDLVKSLHKTVEDIQMKSAFHSIGSVADLSSNGPHTAKDTTLDVDIVPQSHQHPAVIGFTHDHFLASMRNNSVRALAPSSTPSFTCESFPKEYSPFSFCSGVVDYPFMLPSFLTVSDLEAAARAAASSLNAFLGAACLSDTKKLICANAYLPCVDGVVADDFSTYAPVSSTMALPYKRPCRSLCSATSYTGSSCHGLLEGLGGAVNCSAVDPYTGVAQYDGSDDPDTCNMLTSTAGSVVVAGNAEPYVGHWCKEVLSEVYVPSTSPTNPSLAPYLPPFVMQSILEGTIASIEGLIPQYFPPDCLLHQRQVMCALIFMDPHPVDDLSFLFGRLYLPSFPARELCEQFEDSCAATLLHSVPMLHLNCSAKVSSSLDLFPSQPQTIMSLDLGWGPIDLDTPPNSLPSSTLVMETQCPDGFGVPEFPAYAGIAWIPSTACAMLCPGYMYPKTTIEQIYERFGISSWSCVFLGLGQMVNLYVTDRSKRNVFINIHLITAFCFVIYGALQSAFISNEDLLCSSPTSYHSLDTYPGETLRNRFLANNCAAYAIVSLLVEFAQFWVCFAVFVELWLRVVKGVKDVKRHRRFYFWGGLLVTFANVIVILFYGEPKMIYPGNFFMCSWGVADPLVAYYLRAMPHTIYFSISVLLSMHVVYHCIMVSSRVNGGEKSPLIKLWKSYRILFLFTILLFIFYVPMLFWYGNYLSLVETQVVVDSFVEWSTCTFLNFVSKDSDAYIQTCGRYLSDAYDVETLQVMSMMPIVESAILLVITLNADAKAFWCSVYDVIFRKRKELIMAVTRRDSIVDSTSHEASSMSKLHALSTSSVTKSKPASRRRQPKTSLLMRFANVVMGSVGLQGTVKIVPMCSAASKYLDAEEGVQGERECDGDGDEGRDGDGDYRHAGDGSTVIGSPNGEDDISIAARDTGACEFSALPMMPALSFHRLQPPAASSVTSAGCASTQPMDQAPVLQTQTQTQTQPQAPLTDQIAHDIELHALFNSSKVNAFPAPVSIAFRNPHESEHTSDYNLYIEEGNPGVLHLEHHGRVTLPPLMGMLPERHVLAMLDITDELPV